MDVDAMNEEKCRYCQSSKVNGLCPHCGETKSVWWLPNHRTPHCKILTQISWIIFAFICVFIIWWIEWGWRLFK
jgi:hypothetical protein